MFPGLIENALKNRKTTLYHFIGGYDFVYVKDAAGGIVLLGEHKQRNNFEDYNISSGRFTAMMEIFETVKDLTDCKYDESKTTNKEIKKFSLSIKKQKQLDILLSLISKEV